MSNEQFPLPTGFNMPPEMRKALFGSASTDDERDFFMEVIEPIPNPWTPRSADDKRVKFEGEDDEERQYSEVHQPLERLFRGVPDTATCEPASGRFRFSKQEPTAPADSLEKRAPKPEPEENPIIAAWSREFLRRTLGDENLTVKYRKTADGDVWAESVDQSGAIKEAMLVLEPDDEVLAQLEK